MASIYSNPDYVAKLPKNGFPLFQPVKFTSTAGQLLPVFACFLNPGEKIGGKVSCLTRTKELESPAMTEIDEFVDYFFVPAKKLYSIFGEWYFGIDDNPTALRPSINAARVRFLPSITPARMYQFWSNQFIDEEEAYGRQLVPIINEYNNFDRPSTNTIRLLQHLRFDVYTLFDGSSTSERRDRLWNIPLLPFLAYQAIYYDYYRDSNWQNNDVLAYNIDDWLTDLSADNISDNRLARIFELHHRRQNADYFTNIKPSPLQNATSMLNIDGVREAALLRVNDWLSPAGLTFDFVQKGGSNTAVAMGSPIPTDGIDDSEILIEGDGSPLGSISSEVVVNKAHSNGWLSMDHQNILTDVGDLTNLNRDLLSGSEGSTRAGLDFRGNLQANVNSIDGSILSLSVTGLQDAIGTLKSAITSSGIRTMFALEKLAKITGRAGKHYDDQVLAHFGYKVPQGVSNEVYFIGSQHGNIGIGEVISPSTTEGSVAGEMVGKGYGGIRDGKDIDFTAPCHGFFVAIYSSAPRRTYTPVGSPKEFSQFERQDFLMPELMNLGMQPLFPIEFTTDSSDALIGNLWQWRYSELKSKVPMAIGGFARYSESDPTLNGDLQDWTIQYPIFNRANRAGDYFGFGYKNLLVNQMSYNSIMLLHWQPLSSGGTLANYHVARNFDRDPLFHDFVNNFYLSSYASTFGEPNID